MTRHGPANRATHLPVDGTQDARIGEAIDVLESAVADADGDALFLWTGGKEANVIADLLLYEIGPIQGVSPVPFGIIETGNEFEEMIRFRNQYLTATGDQGGSTIGPKTGINDVSIRRYDAMIEHVIQNPTDPRGYHGEYAGEWQCPECQASAEVDADRIECSECGTTTELHPTQQAHTDPDEWGVAESCGALKVVPMKRFIEDGGFTTLITGVRSTDPIANTTDSDGVDHVVETREPAPHTRINPLANWATENIWAYIKAENVSIPSLYSDGYQHTDTKCCTESDTQIGERGEGGRDPEKVRQRDQLEAMGYV